MTDDRLIDISTSAAKLTDDGRIIDPHLVAQADDLVIPTAAPDLFASWRTPAPACRPWAQHRL